MVRRLRPGVLKVAARPASVAVRSHIVFDCRMANDVAMMPLRFSMADFRKMSDGALEQLINTNSSRYDIQGALFEHRRRTRQHDTKVGGSRHKQILCWTTVGAIAAIIAAIAGIVAAIVGVLMLLR
jgi:hypothetical protein